MKKFTFILTASAVLMLAACGNTKGERALSGAGIGAGVTSPAGRARRE